MYESLQISLTACRVTLNQGPSTGALDPDPGLGLTLNGEIFCHFLSGKITVPLVRERNIFA
jgi:hypothetical protein